MHPTHTLRWRKLWRSLQEMHAPLGGYGAASQAPAPQQMTHPRSPDDEQSTAPGAAVNYEW